MCTLTRKCLTKVFSNYCGLVIVISLILNQVISSIQITSNKDLLSSNKNHYDTNYYLSTKLNRYKRQLRENNQSCQIPYHPIYTKYKISEESATSYTTGDYVQERSILVVSCDEGYNLNPFANKYSFCISGKWESEPTICSRTCPSLSSTLSTTVKCNYEGIPLDDCINPVNKTRAILSCTPFYEDSSISRNPIRVCRNGKWNPPIPQCYPICGMKTPKGTPNIINGTNAPVGDYPWQVGVYNTRKELICGGSIIAENIVLSAAHCFTDHRGNVRPTTNYYIGAGKYYRQYDDDRDELAQYSNVLYIGVPENYKGGVHFYGSDIAILVLADQFTLSEVVQPVCVVLNDEIEDIMHLQLNDTGIVTGWGHTQEGRRLSEELKELIVPYIPYQKCFDEVAENFRRYITPDKICGGYTNSGTSICQGDSGGALVFKNVNSNRYYVKGIVSTSPSTRERVCDSNAYSLYTAVGDHISFVRDHVQDYQSQQSVELTSQSRRGCLFPSSPPNGKYIYLHPDNNKITSGDYVPTKSALILSCNLGYEDISLRTTRSYCEDNEQWMPTLTTCKKSEEKSDDCFVFGEDGIGNCSKIYSCAAFTKFVEYILHMDEYESLYIKSIRKYQCDYTGEFTKVCCYATNKSVETLFKNIQEATYSPHDVSNHKNIDLLPKECGVISGDNRTSNWDKAELFEFPWMAVFIYGIPNEPREDKLQCVGTIINDRYILTAASCVTQSDIYHQDFLLGVTVGIYSYKREPSCEIKSENISACADPYQEIEIEDVVVHMHYDSVNEIDDIALVRLRRPLQFSRSLQPICLPISDEFNTEDLIMTRLTLTGWNRNTAYNDPENSDLHKAEVIVVPLIRQCEILFGGRYNMFNITNTKLLCLNDLHRKNVERMAAGGPLQGIKFVTGNLRYVQFGIDLNSYMLGIAVRVDYYMNWILDNIKI